MSYSIVQDAEVKFAVSLQRNAGIFSIRLIEANVKCKSPLTEYVGVPYSFAAEFFPGDSECIGNNLSVSTRFSFRIIADKDKSEIIVLNCVMGAQYVLADGFQPSPEQLKAFKEGPAIFNCWPYFREYVQSTVVRMNYPPPTIPFLWLERRTSEVAPAPKVDTTSEPTKVTKPSHAKKKPGSEGV
jgi:hypothetical protein